MTTGRLFPLIGSFVFFWVAPATVGGLIPRALSGWRMQPPLMGLETGRVLGLVLVVAGVAIVVESFLRFAIVGLGTPAPIAPTATLVVSGLYRHVRNPMYVGVLSAIVGQSLWLGHAGLLAYGGFVWMAFHVFVLLYEEPTLRRRYGPSYANYCAHVGRWWPRWRPWSPE